jgi:predicted transposase/invertase (TIGR01784 family)
MVLPYILILEKKVSEQNMQKNTKNQKKIRKAKIPIKSDGLFKKIMQDVVAAREFLEFYLPPDFKDLVDLTKIRVEKESFVEDDLKRRLSDIVYTVKTKDNEDAFVYVLIESQSTPDYWMSFRLWKYMLLLSERHMKDKSKLPLIAPLLVYNGTKKYNSPRNLWDLFTLPEQAKKLMTEDYKLIDLQSMSDDEIKKKQHLGMVEYFLKHIHQRDMIKLWEQFLENFKETVLIDKANGYIYLKLFIWYTDSKVSEERQKELSEVLVKHLSEQEEASIMRTIAQKYIDEGIEQGIEQGREETMQKTVINMLMQNADIKFISKVTGYSIDRIEELKNKL